MSPCHLEGNLLDGIPDELALGGSELLLERGGLAGSIGASESTSTPRRAAAYLRKVGKLRKGGRVTEGNEDYAVVGERRDGVDNRRLWRSNTIVSD